MPFAIALCSYVNSILLYHCGCFCMNKELKQLSTSAEQLKMVLSRFTEANGLLTNFTPENDREFAHYLVLVVDFDIVSCA